MRVLRTILGMLLLTIGLPSLLAGTALWAAMQHRDQGGAFTGELQRLATPGYAFVIPDVDRLLRSDAPFTRIGDTQLRINARTGDGPAFLGLAPTATVEDYLRGVPHSTIRTVDIGTGALPVATNALPGRLAPRQLPGQTSFWLRSSADGQLAWTPGDVRGGPYSLVIMSAGAKPGLQLTSSAELRPGWLNSSTWGLLTLGTLLLMVGLIVLSWPARRREVVYVVEPSQVPDLMAAIGAPLPLNTLSPARPVGAHRPRTLADSQKAPALAAAPQLTWPPALSGPPNPEEYAAATAIPGGSKSSVPVGAMALGAEPGSVLAAAAGSVGSAAGPAVGGAAGRGGAGAVGGSGVGLVGGSAGGSPVGLAGGSASDPGGSTGGSAVGSNLGSGSAVGAAAPMPASASAAGRSAAGRKPAPGEPLGFIKPTSVGGAVSLPLGDPPSAADPLFGRRLDRGGKLRAPEPGDLPLFQASAVGAWVAETAAERARVTEATAAARMAEVARRRAAANGSRPTTDTPNGRGGAPARDARADDSVAATALAAPPASSGPVSSGPVSSGPVSSGPVSSAPVSSAPAKAGTAASAPNGSVAGGTAAVPQGSAESAPASAGAGPAGSTPVPATPADSDDEHGEPGTEASRRPSPGRPSPGNGGGRRGRHASPSQAPSGDDAVAAAYAAGAADARAFRGEVAPRSAEMPERVPADSTMARDPRTAGQRVAVITGPNATDWTALGLTRADSPRIGRQQPTSARPAPGRQAPGGSRPSPAAPAPVSRNATPAASPTAGTQGIGVPAPTAQAAGMPGAAAQAADVPAPVAH
ncbi:hypothetical protein, partial [Paractinoplanes rishiriensis]|uniref:hypothetical protein n=1 Tax=Paractinoplanes rishiriensis TaxID=1050105 RepID=UPI0019418AFA